MPKRPAGHRLFLKLLPDLPLARRPNDAFANYGYGPQAGMAQPGFNTSPSATPFGPNQLYSTPQLSINTQTNGSGMSAQLQPPTRQPDLLSNSSSSRVLVDSRRTATLAHTICWDSVFQEMNMLGFPYNGQNAQFFPGASTSKFVNSLYLTNYRALGSSICRLLTFKPLTTHQLPLSLPHSRRPRVPSRDGQYTLETFLPPPPSTSS